MLRKAITSGKDVRTTRKYQLSLPSEEAHHQTHQTGGIHGMAQKVHPTITEVSTVSHMVRHHVNNDLCKDDKPAESDRAYNSTKCDIKNHVYRAKKSFELSKYDQHNLELKLQALRDDSNSTRF